MMIRNILSILNRAEKRRLGLLMGLDILISVADIVFLAILLLIIERYTNASAAVGRWSFLLSWMGGQSPVWAIGLFFFLFSLKNAGGYLIYRAQCRYLLGVATRVSRKRLLAYLEGAYSSYVQTDNSVHIREISYHPLDFSQHVLGGFQQIMTQLVLILLAITGIVLFNVKLFILLLVILLPPVVAIFYFIRRRLRTVRETARTSSERSLQYLQEALTGFVESNVYHKNDAFLERYIGAQERFNRSIADQLIMQGIPNRLVEVFAMFGLVVLIGISHFSGTTDHAAVLTIGVFMAAAYKIIPGIVKVMNAAGQVNAYSFTVKDLAREAEMDIREGQGAAGAEEGGEEGMAAGAEEGSEEGMAAGAEEGSEERMADAGEGVACIRSIDCRQLVFSYNGKPVLKGQDLLLTAGDFVGVSGLSGKGKTTLVNLLLGFLTPDSGDIHINGNLTDAGMRRAYWKRIAYVKQQPFLLHATVLQNITLNGSVADEGRLKKAAGHAGLSALVDTFPEKWDKVIAENGKNISGGQRQRIAIARALYKRADLIILDEPFNELDQESEIRLLRHMQELAGAGRLVILITHNKESLSFCNKIITLDE